MNDTASSKVLRLQTLATASIAIGLLVLALKYFAYACTGSVALYSDAIESIVNVVTAIAALVAIRISAKPADADHHYGHSKIEYFSAVLEGVLIIGASLAIIQQAWHGYFNPKPLDAPALGLALNGLATAINAGWSWMLITKGRALRSPALVADGRHLLTDLYTSGGVIVGVLLVLVTGWQPLDALIAGAVALNVLWAGWGVMKESLAGLMDESLPKAELDRVKTIIAEKMGGALEAHDLRTRHAGRIIFIDFHLVVDGAMTVDAAHQICDDMEAALRVEFPDAVISIHTEPAHKCKADGGVYHLADPDLKLNQH